MYKKEWITFARPNFFNTGDFIQGYILNEITALLKAKSEMIRLNM